MTLRPGFPERGGLADRFQTIDRRLAALERSGVLAISADGIISSDLRSENYDGLPQVPGSGPFTAGFFIDVSTGSALFAATVFLKSLSMLQVSSTEGGELVWEGAASFPDWIVDVFEDVMRWRTGANIVFELHENADIGVTETAAAVAYHNGSSVVLSRVTVGATNSGGAGFRLLRVPN